MSKPRRMDTREYQAEAVKMLTQQGMSAGKAAVKELAEPFSMTLPAIFRHLKVLKKAELIERSRDSQSRPCKLCAKPLKEAASWVDRYCTFWEESLDRLDDHLKELQSKPGAKPTSSPRKERSR